jgi:hypothetical protein
LAIFISATASAQLAGQLHQVVLRGDALEQVFVGRSKRAGGLVDSAAPRACRTWDAH